MVAGQILKSCKSSLSKNYKNLLRICRDLILKIQNSQSKSQTFKKLKKKQNSLGINVFVHDNKEKYQIYVSKQCCEEKHVNLLLTGEEYRNYILIKDFSIFMYDHTLQQEMLKTHIKDCFKTNCKKRIILPKVNLLNSKIMKEK